MRIISGEYGGRHIKTVAGPGYRPATDKVRQALFSMLEARGVIWSECRVLDLFAGSGSLGFEALSRGAREVWFVEKMKRAAWVIKQNAEVLGVLQERFRVVAKDVRSVIKKGPYRPFDLIFVDPPYGLGLLEPVLYWLEELAWLKPEGIVAAEIEADLRTDFDFPSEMEQLVNKTYGQTRICLWQLRGDAKRFIREPSIP